MVVAAASSGTPFHTSHQIEPRGRRSCRSLLPADGDGQGGGVFELHGAGLEVPEDAGGVLGGGVVGVEDGDEVAGAGGGLGGAGDGVVVEVVGDELLGAEA